MLKQIILVSLCILSSQAHASALSDLDKFLHNSQVAAEFTQTVYGTRTNSIRRGKMQLERPNKFRWEYQDGLLIISDSKNIYLYDKPLHQVTQKKLNALLDTSPALLLAGGIDIKKYYKLTVLRESGGLEWVRLTPKKSKGKSNDNNGFVLVEVGFIKNTQLLTQMRFIDSFGGKSAISFTGIKVNIKAPISTFAFTPPPGVDVN